MKIQYPDYNNCITNLSCSVLKYFGVKDVRHNTIPELDSLLFSRKPRNVVIMLFDGMGVSILNRHLHKNCFLNKHVVKTISSTFPPTTVAATTSINTGLYPNETGWLGWVTYYKEVNSNVITFFNTLQSDDSPASEKHLGYTLMPFKSLSMQIKETDNSISCKCIAPFTVNPFDETIISSSIKQNCNEILRITKEPGRHFLYGYWADPDHTMHEVGIDKPDVTEIMKIINSEIRKLSKKLGDDTMVIVTADHGLINAKWDYLSDYPELMNMLVRPHSLENRAVSFFVKDGMLDAFKKTFNKVLGEHFFLLDHKQFMESKLLGTGDDHPRTDSYIGDYVAISKLDHCIAEYKVEDEMIGIHAGLTDEEMNVPLIIL